MQSDQRSAYRNLAHGAQVFFRCERSNQSEQRYLKGIADDMSLGGIFVNVRYPPPPGTFLSLHIYRGADQALTSPLYAKAVVRWRRQWGKPRGMGVQFLELEGLGNQRLDHWLAAIAAPVANQATPSAAA